MAGLDQAQGFVDFLQLVGGTGAVAVLLRLFDEGVAEMPRQPAGAAFGSGHFSRETALELADSTTPLPDLPARKTPVIRITELPLPLDYTPEALRQAILKRLSLPAADLVVQAEGELVTAPRPLVPVGDLALQDRPAPFPVTVRELDGDERTKWWERAVAAYPPYAEYQERTDRTIPVLLATRS